MDVVESDDNKSIPQIINKNGSDILSSRMSLNTEMQSNRNLRKSSITRKLLNRTPFIISYNHETKWNTNEADIYGINGRYKPYSGDDYVNRRTPKEEIQRSPGISCRCEYKWIVLLASLFTSAVSAGFVFHMSVLFVEFLDEFQKTKAETSIIQSVAAGVFYCSGFITGSLVSRFAEQKCMIVGAIVSSTGLAMSFFANSITYLVGCIGVLGGFGNSLCYISATSIVSNYFDERFKSTVLGVVSIGGGIGALILPPFLEAMIQKYHWRGALLIMSGITFNMMVAGAISVPNTALKALDEPLETCDRVESDWGNKGKSEDNKLQQPNLSTLSKFLVIFREKMFVSFAFCMMMTLPCFNSLIIFLIDYYEFIGFERSTGVWLYTGMNLANVVFRFLPGCIALVPRIPKLVLPASYTLLGSVALGLFPFCDTVTQVGIVTCVFGTSHGGIIATMSITSYHLVSKENFSTALGIVLTLAGISQVIAGPLAGYIRDTSGSYEYLFYSGAGVLLGATILLLVTNYFTSRTTKE